MAYIDTGRPIYTKTPNHRGTTLERRKNFWMHLNCTCIVTGQPDFDIAHTGGEAQGKAMARKSNLDTFLPLIRALHVHEEAGREGFWLGVGLPNYLKLAADLHELFLNSQDPTWFLEDAQSRVDREYVRLLLEGPDF